MSGEDGGLVEATRSEVVDIKSRVPSEHRRAAATDAALALALAKEIDFEETSATAKSNCAKAHAEVMANLRSMVPPAKEADGVDDARASRQRRLDTGGPATEA